MPAKRDHTFHLITGSIAEEKANNVKTKKEHKWAKLSGGNSYPQSVDWDLTQELIGVLEQVREVDFGNRKVKVAEIVKEDGERVSVWETVRLRPLFDVLPGTWVKIVNKGFIKTKLGRKVRDFEIWVDLES
jgi:hypothetical protein